MKKHSIIAAFTIALGILFFPHNVSASKRPTVNIVNYGAVPNDSKCDDAAIQKALDKASKINGTVYIPKGTWYLSKTLLISSNTVVNADSHAVIKRHSNYYFRNIMRSKSNAGGYSGTSNISIIGGTWDGNNFNHLDTARNLFYFYHGKNILIKNINIKNVVGNHFIELAAVQNAVITNCTFSNYQKCSASGSSSTSEAIQLDYASKSTSSCSYPYDNTACNTISITNNTFRNCLSGIGTHHAAVAHYNITIANNNFENIRNTCLNLANMKKVKSLNNRASNVVRFVSAWGGSTGYFFQNTVNANNRSTIRNTYDFSNSSIKINKDNILSSNQNAIKSSNSTITIQYCSISNVAHNGIYIPKNGSKLYAKKNKISNCGKSAVHLINNQKYKASFVDNSFSKNKVYGFFIEKSKAKVYRNYALFNKKADIFFDSKSTGSIKKNTVTRKSSLKYKKKTVTVKSNRCKK